MSNLNLLGPVLDFTCAEAYKLLRTNIVFSLPDKKDCYVIGITSSERSEGKSVTSINLAYTMAEQGKKVLLIEGDMRLPGVSVKLNIKSVPGLSNVLVTKDSKSEAVIRHSGLNDDMHVLTAGEIPPNPSELLSSKKMETLMETLKESYDCIIIDLPPVNIVSDTLVVSPLLDGVVFVVREDYSTKRSVTEAIRQLEFAEIKILGFVTTFSNSGNGKYYKYKKKGNKYEKYYKKNYKYAKNYEYSRNKVKQEADEK